MATAARSTLLPDNLRIIGVEEHIMPSPDLMQQMPNDETTEFAKQYSVKIMQYPEFQNSTQRLGLDDNSIQQRLADMRASGTSFQVLSRTAAVNAWSMKAGEGAALIRDLNDQLKETVDKQPQQFAAFAELPFQSPTLAIEELHRCVQGLDFVGMMLHGSVNGKFLDDPEFGPLLTAFEELDVPLYLHPGLPPKAVFDDYYSFPEQPLLGTLLTGPGWGWHQEVAVHILRLAISEAGSTSETEAHCWTSGRDDVYDVVSIRCDV